MVWVFGPGASGKSWCDLAGDMTEIIPHLYVAGVKEVRQEVETKRFGVTHILNVAPEIICDQCEHGYHYMCSGVDDDDPRQDISATLDSNTNWIKDALSGGGTVMVHCWSGVSRSPVTVMAYLIRYCNMTAVDAFHKVLAKRPIVEPWPRYLEQLQKWARSFVVET